MSVPGVTRTAYAAYLLARLSEALAVALGAALLAHLLQSLGMLRPVE
jgi:hypothetical protein